MQVLSRHRRYPGTGPIVKMQKEYSSSVTGVLRREIAPSLFDPPETPLRFLQLVEAALGGVGRHVLDVTEGLIARGHEVHLVYSPTRADHAFLGRLDALSGRSRLTMVAVPIERRVTFRDALHVRWLRRYLQQHGPFDIIHTHSSKAGLIGRLAALGTATRAFYTPHGLFTLQPGLGAIPRAVATVVEVGLASACEKIIAVSQLEYRHALSLGIPAHRITAIPNGKDVVLPGRQAEIRNQLRSGYAIADDVITIGCIGRLTSAKAIDHLLCVFERLYRDLGDKVRLLIVGDGELRGVLHGQCSALGLDRAVCWLGEFPGEEALCAFDIFALSSDHEGLSYAVIEALAAGLPVVMTNVGGAEELVLEGVNGYRVPTRDVPAFAAVLQRLIEDRDLRARMGRASLLHANCFTLDRMLDQIVDLYCSSPVRGAARIPSGRQEFDTRKARYE